MTKFYKYQGTGNDFIMIDNRSQNLAFDQKQIESLCHRRFGIGADGFILIENEPAYDFKMVYYNADGRASSMCGNGGRCAVKFAHDLGIFKGKTRFLAVDGPHEAAINGPSVSLGMINVNTINEEADGVFLNTGSPHLVVFQNKIDDLAVKEKGSGIRYNPYWSNKGGVNVNFVEQISESELKIRTYERGVEDETYSCGTGVTAGALAAFYKNLSHSELINIQTLGGNLQVSFSAKNDSSFQNIMLIGPAERVFEGEF